MLKMTILKSILAISASRSLLEAVKALVKRQGSALAKRERVVGWGDIEPKNMQAIHTQITK